MDSSKTIIPFLPLPAGRQFIGYSLDMQQPQFALLPDEHELVINSQTGHFLIVNWDTRYIVADGIFRDLELQLMLVVLRAWPSYIPTNKMLYAVFDASIKDIDHLFEADQAAVRATVDRLVDACNIQLRIANIAIQNINNQGYKLSRLEEVEMNTEAVAIATDQAAPCHEWPTITEEQLRQDQRIRLEQAADRRLVDVALREAGRVWTAAIEIANL